MFYETNPNIFILVTSAQASFTCHFQWIFSQNVLFSSELYVFLWLIYNYDWWDAHFFWLSQAPLLGFMVFFLDLTIFLIDDKVKAFLMFISDFQ